MVFYGLASKPMVMVFSGFASKPVAMFFSSLASKPVAMVFSSLVSKLVAMVSWLSLKTNVEEGFPGLCLKTGSYSFLVWASKSSRLRFIGCITKLTGGCDGVGHALQSSHLLHVEGSLARVSQSSIKTGGGTTAGGARGTIAEVASESS
jgi:hypothetical protein